MFDYFKRDVDPIFYPCCEMWTTHAMSKLKNALEHIDEERSNISFGRSLPFQEDGKVCLTDTYTRCNKEYSYISNHFCDLEPDKFKEDLDKVEIILFMILDYPFEFGFCTLDDFRDAYLNGCTDIKVELDHKGVFFELNRCIPLTRTTISKLKKTICESDGTNKYYCIKSNILHSIELYFDYLIYSIEQDYEQEPHGEEWWEEATERERNNYFSYRRHSCVDVEHPKFGYSTTKVVRNKYVRHSKYEVQSKNYPYYVTTMDEYGNLVDRWMYFDEFIQEAKKIRKMVSDPEKGPKLLEEYPELKKMTDIEELYLYDCWRKYGDDIDLSFLKKDWYDEQRSNDYRCGFFQDEYPNLKDVSDDILNKIKRDYLSRNDDCLTKDSDDISMEQLRTITRTAWGFKKEPNPAYKIFPKKDR